MQVKEKVNVSNLMMIGMQAGNEKNISKTDKDTDSLSFANIFAQSKSDANENSFVNEKSQDTSKVNSTVVQKDSSVRSEKNVADGMEPEKASIDNADRRQLVTDDADMENVSVDVIKESEDLTEEEISAALEAVSDILQMIMQQLGLSAKEVEEQLSMLGMEVSDLMTPMGLKEFFLNLQSADVSDLLTDENLNQAWQQFAEEFNRILQENGWEGSDLENALKFMEKTDGKEILLETADWKETAVEKDNHFPEFISEEAGMGKEPEVIVSRRADQGMQDSSFARNQSTSGQMQEHASKTLEEAVTKDVKAFENPILQAIHDAVGQIDETAVLREEPVRAMDVIEQIVEQVRVNMNQDTSSMELQLYPEHLGKIQIQVVSKDGIMTARIVAETEAAKQAIEGGLTNLKDAMEHQNLKVEAIEVMVSTTGFERGNEDQMANEQRSTGRNRRKLDLSEPDEEISIEDEAEAEKMKASGSSVSYMA